jgi:hypothetical protein
VFNFVRQPIEVRLKAEVIVMIAQYREAPSMKAALVRPLGKGQRLTVFGRSEDSHWVTTDREGRLWVYLEHIALDGNIDTLPVVAPEQWSRHSLN